MTTPNSVRRWYHLTPDRVFVGLLVVQVFLFLSGQFKWFPFNERKGWTALIAVGVVAVAVLVILVWGLVSLCLRWRFQFGVRSLLLFVVAVSVPLAWFAWEIQKAQRQREAVEWIVEMDGMASYDWEDSWLYRVEPPTPAWLRKLFGDDFFSDVVRIRFSLAPRRDSRNVLDDNGLKHLNVLKNLRTLDLPNMPITEEGLEHLETLTNLEHLWISCPYLTDGDLARLRHALPDCDIMYWVATP